MEYADALVGSVSEKVGVPLDQARFTVGVLLSFPVGLLMRAVVYHIPLWSRHVLSMFLGSSLFWYIYRADMIHAFTCSIVVFLLLRFGPVKYSYILSFVWCIGYILCMHVHVMLTAYLSWSIDFTAPLMVLIIKLTSYGFCLHDGVRAKAGEKLTERQEKYKLEEPASLLEFYGWVLFFPGFFGGPAIEFSDYRKYMDGTMFKDVPGNRIPHCVGACVKALAGTFICIAIVGLFGKYGVEFIRQEVANPENAFKYSLGQRLLIIYRGCIIQRSKYYICWLMGEVACLCCGVGYSGKVRDPKTGEMVDSWQNSINVYPLKFEFAPSMKVAVDTWNIATEGWLRHYCYERLIGTRFAGLRRYATFLLSAVWHGLYPAYYIFFLSAAVHREVAGMARRKIRPYVLSIPQKFHPQFLYDIITTAFTLMTMNYCAITFAMLSFKDSINLWRNTYFVGHYYILLGLIVLPLIPTKKSDKKASTPEGEGKPEAASPAAKEDKKTQ